MGITLADQFLPCKGKFIRFCGLALAKCGLGWLHHSCSVLLLRTWIHGFLHFAALANQIGSCKTQKVGAHRHTPYTHMFCPVRNMLQPPPGLYTYRNYLSISGIMRQCPARGGTEVSRIGNGCSFCLAGNFLRCRGR